MHKSIFSYNLTRPYPYPWFTWVVVVGGIISTALLTLINLAANGYEPSIAYTDNPNKTLDSNSTAWFTKKPWSFASKVSSDCQDHIFQDGEKIKTHSSSFQYEIRSVKDSGTHISRRTELFAYNNAILQDCFIDKFTMDVNGSSLKVNYEGYINCTVYRSDVRTTIYLHHKTTGAGYNKPAPNLNNTDFDSLSYILIQNALNMMRYAYNGSFSYCWSKAPGSTDPGSLEIGATVTNQANGQLTSMLGRLNSTTPSLPLRPAHCEGDRHISFASWSHMFGGNLSSCYQIQPADEFSPSNYNATIVVIADYITKVIQSRYLSDLGQSVQHNIFANDHLLLKSCKSMKDWFGIESNFSKGFSCNQLETNVANSRVQDVGFDALYLCQVPRLKSMASLVITVIVTNFVFLSTIWTVFTWFAKTLLERQNPKANNCACCARTENFFCKSDPESSSQYDGDNDDAQCSANIGTCWFKKSSGQRTNRLHCKRQTQVEILRKSPLALRFSNAINPEDAGRWTTMGPEPLRLRPSICGNGSLAGSRRSSLTLTILPNVTTRTDSSAPS